MRLIRLLAVPAAIALALAGSTAVSAAPTPTRIVLYTGGGNTKPVGPAGPLGYNWTIQAAPAEITITGHGTLTEIPKAKQVASTCTPPQCSQWWYRVGSTGKNPATYMPQAYWEQTGKSTITLGLGITANPSSWAVAPDGAWTPHCLQWAASSGGVAYYAVLSKSHDWVMSSEQACITS